MSANSVQDHYAGDDTGSSMASRILNVACEVADRVRGGTVPPSPCPSRTLASIGPMPTAC